ncbi:hypothetical protein BaGK_10760 [Bacillus atrophaeus]|nr:hypothetical protein BaGK_10760 [Bacillus atrophaeus]
MPILMSKKDTIIHIKFLHPLFQNIRPLFPVYEQKKHKEHIRTFQNIMVRKEKKREEKKGHELTLSVLDLKTDI